MIIIIVPIIIIVIIIIDRGRFGGTGAHLRWHVQTRGSACPRCEYAPQHSIANRRINFLFLFLSFPFVGLRVASFKYRNAKSVPSVILSILYRESMVPIANSLYSSVLWGVVWYTFECIREPDRWRDIPRMNIRKYICVLYVCRYIRGTCLYPIREIPLLLSLGTNLARSHSSRPRELLSIEAYGTSLHVYARNRYIQKWSRNVRMYTIAIGRDNTGDYYLYFVTILQFRIRCSTRAHRGFLLFVVNRD